MRNLGVSGGQRPISFRNLATLPKRRAVFEIESLRKGQTRGASETVSRIAGAMGFVREKKSLREPELHNPAETSMTDYDFWPLRYDLKPELRCKTL